MTHLHLLANNATTTGADESNAFASLRGIIIVIIGLRIMWRGAFGRRDRCCHRHCCRCHRR